MDGVKLPLESNMNVCKNYEVFLGQEDNQIPKK